MSQTFETDLSTRMRRVLQALRTGTPVVLFDDDDREGEADLIVAASRLTVPEMARLIRDGSGIVCLCQPWIGFLHGWSVLIMLIGLISFNVSVHIPPPEQKIDEDGKPHPEVAVALRPKPQLQTLEVGRKSKPRLYAMHLRRIVHVMGKFILPVGQLTEDA